MGGRHKNSLKSTRMRWVIDCAKRHEKLLLIRQLSCAAGCQPRTQALFSSKLNYNQLIQCHVYRSVADCASAYILHTLNYLVNTRAFTLH